jgi:hypothetical protein
MRIQPEEKIKIGAQFFAALISNPNWNANNEETASHAWMLTETYCDFVAEKTKKQPKIG